MCAWLMVGAEGDEAELGDAELELLLMGLISNVWE